MQSKRARYTTNTASSTGAAVKLFIAARFRTIVNPNLFNNLLSRSAGCLGMFECSVFWTVFEALQLDEF